MGPKQSAARGLLTTTLLLAYLSSVPTTHALTTQEEMHQKLINATAYPLYDASVRPMADSAGGPVIVEIDAVLISIGPVNALDMTWTLSCYFRQEWKDPRLISLPNASNPAAPAAGAGSGGQRPPMVQMGFGEVNRLWVPDIYFANSKNDRKHVVTVPNQLVYVTPDTGSVLYSQRLTTELHCTMNLQKFPHDTQRCEIMIESYSYTTDNMILKWSSSRSATDFLPTAFIPDFSVKAIETLDCTTTYAIGTFPCLKALVTLERKIGYYITQNYIPTILIVILSWASFWINHEAVPARISVGLLTVLTITTQLSGTRAELPKVPYVKAIDVWMSACLVFVFAAYMEYAVVTVLSRRYRKRLAGQRVRSIFKVVAERSRSNGQPGLRSIVEAAKAAKKKEEEEEEAKSNDTATSRPPTSSVSGMEAGMLNSTFKSKLYRKEEDDQSADKPPASSPAKKALSDFEKAGMDTGRVVDQLCRLLFPIAFGIFNVVYWVFYTFWD